MIRSAKIFCKKQLFDRDFLYGFFAKEGFLRNPEEFLKKSDDFFASENDVDDDSCNGFGDELKGIL
jgi:hypothetical protein